MATESVNPLNWLPTLRHQDPTDTHYRKLVQAEALAKVTVGEDFYSFNDAIQHNVLWLLSDLLTEAREARDDESEIRRNSHVD